MYEKFLRIGWTGVGALVALGFLANPAWASLTKPVPEPSSTALLAGGLAAAALAARLWRRK